MDATIATVVGGLFHALDLSFSMFWEILWALVLGFALSGAVQAVVTKAEMIRLLPDDSPRTLGLACGLGAASSSCSYAAVALARSIVRKGGNFTAAMAFEFASTNLVVELGIILWLLMGWQFALAEFAGGVVMIAILAVLFRVFLRDRLLEEARRNAERGLLGSIVGALSFVCSIGNVPLAAVLWNGGISFGGVASFVFADLIVLPILNIYRKYYEIRMTGFLLATFYAAMVLAGYLVEILFG